MLNKSMMIKLLVFAMILVGCASSDVVTEKAKKVENSKVQEEKVADNDSSEAAESSENNGMTATQNEYTEPQQETASSNGQYTTYDTQQPDQSVESVEPVDNTSSGGPAVEQPQVPACDDTIPYGGYTSWTEVNVAAQAELNRKVLDEGWFTGRYQVDISQTECGTVYYTYQCWVSN